MGQLSTILDHVPCVLTQADQQRNGQRICQLEDCHPALEILPGPEIKQRNGELYNFFVPLLLDCAWNRESLMRHTNEMKLFTSIATATVIGISFTAFVSTVSHAQVRPAIACCTYNDKRMGNCEFYLSSNGLRIEWSDGLIESYKLISQAGFHYRTYVDKRGGVWDFMIHPQGNYSLTNSKNGNRIWKPLRGCYV